MDFKNGQPIYIQIAERLCDELLAGTYPTENRIPGVREYSALLEVNVNTIVKVFDHLARQGIIYPKRGMGYFVSTDAQTIILKERKQRFIDEVLPDFFKQLMQLNIPMEEVDRAFSAYQQKLTL